MRDDTLIAIANKFITVYDNTQILAADARCERRGGKVACSIFSVINAMYPTASSLVFSGSSGPVYGAPCCDGVSDPCGCIHAEAKAAIACRSLHSYDERFCAVVTRAPCRKCAELLIHAGVKVVVCPSPEKGEAGKPLLLTCGVSVLHIDIEEFVTVYGLAELGRTLLVK